MSKTLITEEMFEQPQEVVDLLKPYCYYYSNEDMDELMKCLQYIVKKKKTNNTTKLICLERVRSTYDGKINVCCTILKNPSELGYNVAGGLSVRDKVLLDSDELQQGRMEYLCTKLGICLVQEQALHHPYKEYTIH